MPKVVITSYSIHYTKLYDCLFLSPEMKSDMLEICAIASGSNGNCYYIGNETSAVLIDAGISTKQILFRMAERNLNPAKLRALFITHEHSDHIRGARVLGKRLRNNFV